jgi:hypothetical protein
VNPFHAHTDCEAPECRQTKASPEFASMRETIHRNPRAVLEITSSRKDDSLKVFHVIQPH